MVNGTIIIRIYANDTIGNTAFDQLIVRKDIDAPNVTITAPANNDLFSLLVPGISYNANEASGIHSTWYNISDGITTIVNYTWTGVIFQDHWVAMANGTIIIRIYANDTMGNTAFDQVIVRKDINAPSVSITSPDNNDLFGLLAPSITYDANDASGINRTWYWLSDGATSFTNYSWTGALYQDHWAAMVNGTITIRIYANDTESNVAFDQVIIRKDIAAPNITINPPLNYTIFEETAPQFNITIIEANLNQNWYQIKINAGWSDPYYFIGNETINQTLWQSLSNGVYLIRFYANDTMGNEAYKDVIVEKYIPPSTDDDDNDSNNKKADKKGGIGFGNYFIIVALTSFIALILYKNHRYKNVSSVI